MISKYDLHDSTVEDLIYLQDEAKLTIEIESCNWRQSSYEDSEPEMLKIFIVFTGVKKCELDPEPMSFQSDEILEVMTIKSDVEGSESIKMVLRGEDDVKVVIITANDAILVNE